MKNDRVCPRTRVREIARKNESEMRDVAKVREGRAEREREYKQKCETERVRFDSE